MKKKTRMAPYIRTGSMLFPIQEKKEMRLDRQLLKFTENCTSLLTVFIDT